jgi:translation initiation factor IF-3
MAIKRGDEPRVNDQITIAKVRLVDENGEMLGVTATDEALRKAQDAGLDLVEVSPNADPPVCKILNYGKFKYEAQKKANEARKKQKVITVKELKIRPNIDTNDLEVKQRAMHKFLGEGDKVKFTMRFRGREMAHQQRGMDILNAIKEELGETVKMEQEPRMEGRQMIMIMAPAK